MGTEVFFRSSAAPAVPDLEEEGVSVAGALAGEAREDFHGSRRGFGLLLAPLERRTGF